MIHCLIFIHFVMSFLYVVSIRKIASKGICLRSERFWQLKFPDKGTKKYDTKKPWRQKIAIF